VGEIPHMLTFGLLNKHKVAGWPASDDGVEYLSFAFVVGDDHIDSSCTGSSVVQIRDEHGHTIALDVEPNFTYVGGYGRKTFIPVSMLDRYNGSLEIWAFVQPHTAETEQQLARFVLRTIRQENGAKN
jgi:hypothetical protein